MNAKPITQHYWERQAQIVQEPKPADKSREERREPQSFLAVLKKQFKEDSITVVLICLATMFGLATVVAQIGIATGHIAGPVYLADLVR